MAYVAYVISGQPRDGIRHAHAYERRFPRGTYAADVLWLRIHALHATDQLEACREAAHEYLRRHPRAPQTEVASRITRW
jgi:hypothetical protein